MFRQQRKQRAGFTIIELALVIAIIILIGALVVPTLRSLMRDLPTQTAADVTRSRLALARAYAIEQGRAYAVSVSPDGNRIRISVDETDLAGAGSEDEQNLPYFDSETLPEKVKLELAPIADTGEVPPGTTQEGWQILAVFLPNGSCKQSYTTLQLTEPESPTVFIEIRGLTGSSSIVPTVTNRSNNR